MVARYGRLLFPLVAGTLFLGACESSTGNLTSGEVGKLSIRLTDAPGDLAEAWVKIEKIYLQGTAAGDSTSGKQEFTTASTGYVDLLTLSGGNFQSLVTDATIKPGTYRQVRLVLSGAYIRTKDDRYFATPGAELPSGVSSAGELKCPSCAQSGLKVILPGDGVAIDEGNTTLVLDFDVNQSFGHEAGKSGKFILRPVIHATQTEGTQTGGAIKGTVALAEGVAIPACGGGDAPTLLKVVPTATAGETVRTGTTVQDGEAYRYTISGVAAGTYAMGVDRVGFANGDTLTFTATATPSSVTVASAEVQSDYSVTAASCKAAS